jgi:hypothetical protein
MLPIVWCKPVVRTEAQPIISAMNEVARTRFVPPYVSHLSTRIWAIAMPHFSAPIHHCELFTAGAAIPIQTTVRLSVGRGVALRSGQDHMRDSVVT